MTLLIDLVKFLQPTRWNCITHPDNKWTKITHKFFEKSRTLAFVSIQQTAKDEIKRSNDSTPKHLLLINFLFTFLFVIFIDCLSHFFAFQPASSRNCYPILCSSSVIIDLKENCRLLVRRCLHPKNSRAVKSLQSSIIFEANQMKPRMKQTSKWNSLCICRGKVYWLSLFLEHW